MEEVRGDDTLEEVFLELEDTGKRYDPCIAQKTATGIEVAACAAAKLVSNAPGWGRLATRCCLRQ